MNGNLVGKFGDRIKLGWCEYQYFKKKHVFKINKKKETKREKETKNKELWSIAMWVWQQSLVETSKLSSACESNEWGGYKTRIWVIDEEVIKIKIVDGCIIYAIENRRKLINMYVIFNIINDLKKMVIKNS